MWVTVGPRCSGKTDLGSIIIAALRFGVWGLGFRALNPKPQTPDLNLRLTYDKIDGNSTRVEGLGFRVLGFEFRVYLTPQPLNKV